MGGIYETHWRYEKLIQNFGRNTCNEEIYSVDLSVDGRIILE